MTHYENATNNFEKIKEMYCLENKKVSEISRKLNIDRKAIDLLIKERNLKQESIVDKINMLRNTIEFLYCKEGRSINYISLLLELNRSKLTDALKEWNLVQGNSNRMKPSNQKFLNKNRNFIKSKLDSNWSNKEIASKLNIKKRYLEYIINRDSVLKKASTDKNNRLLIESARKKEEGLESKKERIQKCKFNDYDGEIWKQILGYENYWVSNFGRVKSFDNYLKVYKLIALQKNINSGKLYVHLYKDSVRKAFQVARLVAHNFIDGHSEINNTVEHIDNDVQNNYYTNLKWVSQATNNKLAYEKGREIAKAYTKIGKFKYILLNDKYKFKTIRAFAKFIDKSETQARRYIDNEVTNNPYKIEIIR